MMALVMVFFSPVLKKVVFPKSFDLETSWGYAASYRRSGEFAPMIHRAPPGFMKLTDISVAFILFVFFMLNGFVWNADWLPEQIRFGLTGVTAIFAIALLSYFERKP